MEVAFCFSSVVICDWSDDIFTNGASCKQIQFLQIDKKKRKEFKLNELYYLESTYKFSVKILS